MKLQQLSAIPAKKVKPDSSDRLTQGIPPVVIRYCSGDKGKVMLALTRTIPLPDVATLIGFELTWPSRVSPAAETTTLGVEPLLNDTAGRKKDTR